MTDTCAFCAVVRRDKPAYIVFQDELSLAFLDVRPLFPGHCLLVPRKHVETLPELEADMIGPFFTNVQRLTAAVETAMAAEGTFVAINNKVSQSVPHLHVHIVPRRKKDGLRGFFWPRNPYRDEQHMGTVQEQIVRALQTGRRATR
ncbi:MAG: HIT family protein [Calditrichaeota bacterium]|nr:MAG: HIT family protein [Calditrichota bacterium]